MINLQLLAFVLYLCLMLGIGLYFFVKSNKSKADGDKEYLNRCLKYYDDFNIMAAGVLLKESEIPNKICELLKEYNPDIEYFLKG